MSAEREVIDLDEHDHQPAESGTVTRGRLTARRKMNVRLVAAFVVGVVLGGVGVSELRASREERERNASVSVVAFPASTGSGGSNNSGTVKLTGQLALINAGPAPITVREANGQRPGVLIQGIGQSRLLPPGSTGWINVRMQFECSTAFEDEPLSMQFSVETDDRQIREVRSPTALVGSVWQLSAERICELAR